MSWLKEIDINYRFVKEDDGETAHQVFRYRTYRINNGNIIDEKFIEVVGGRLNALQLINRWNSLSNDWKYVLID